MSSMPCQVYTHLLEEDPALTVRMLKVFGRPDDPISRVEKRAREILGEFRTIVYEADAQTLQYRYVSAAAENILGFPLRRWLDDPSFWAQTVVHRDDRQDAMAFSTQQAAHNRGYDFRYRAQTIDGRCVTFLDVVQVTVGARGVADRLRGVMVEVDSEGRLSPRPPMPMHARAQLNARRPRANRAL